MTLLAGLADYLAATIQILEWNPSGIAYPTGVYGLYLLSLPADGVGVALAPYAGPQSSGKRGYDSPNVQARVRGTADPRDAYEAAQGVYNALHGLTEHQLNEGTYVTAAVGLQSGPVYIGKDANGRHELVVNARFEIRNPTAHRETPV